MYVCIMYVCMYYYLLVCYYYAMLMLMINIQSRDAVGGGWECNLFFDTSQCANRRISQIYSSTTHMLVVPLHSSQFSNQI